MKINTENKVVVITGAAGGIGRALCHRFGTAGAKVALLDLNSTAIDAAIAELQTAGISAIGEICDVTDPVECRTAMNKVGEHYGKIDVLINNAGIAHRSAFVNTDIEVFRRVMDVNYFGAVHCTKPAVPYLIESGGSIIIISSISGFSPLYGRTGYSASKYALHGMFESLRTELKESGVHIMMVCPGFTETNIEKNALDGDGSPTTHPRSTTGKIYSPGEVAAAIYNGYTKKKRLLVLSPIGKLAHIVSKLMPAYYEIAMAKKLKKELDR